MDPQMTPPSPERMYEDRFFQRIQTLRSVREAQQLDLDTLELSEFAHHVRLSLDVELQPYTSFLDDTERNPTVHDARTHRGLLVSSVARSLVNVFEGTNVGPDMFKFFVQDILELRNGYSIFVMNALRSQEFGEFKITSSGDLRFQKHSIDI